MNPRVQAVARATRAIAPTTRIGAVAEMLRMGPYRVVAVVAEDAASSPPTRLVGIVTEASVIRALLDAPDGPARAQVREMPVSSIMILPTRWATPSMRASDVALLMDEAGTDVLPVVDAYFTFLGLVARSDLVRDLVRPFRPPTVGGMATPLGVYLTTGRVSGGAGSLALISTGIVMFSVNLLSIVLQEWVGRRLGTLTPLSALFDALPVTVRDTSGEVLTTVLQMAVFLILLRLSPIAGYHAAEHQVVHALERSEPLFVENVRAMPRVHPRCGTNLVAGVFLLLLIGTALWPFLGYAGYAVSGVVALAYWRTLGGWMQQHLTTRPATDAQIESGIRAARQLLDEHNRAPYAAVRPHVRLWRMGFLQILVGFALGGGLLVGVSYLYLPLRVALKPWLEALLSL